MRKVLSFAVVLLSGLVGLIATAWAAGALYFDLPIAWLRTPLALIYGLAMLAALIFVRGRGRAGRGGSRLCCRARVVVHHQAE